MLPQNREEIDDERSSHVKVWGIVMKAAKKKRILNIGSQMMCRLCIHFATKLSLTEIATGLGGSLQAPSKNLA